MSYEGSGDIIDSAHKEVQPDLGTVTATQGVEIEPFGSNLYYCNTFLRLH